MKKIGCEQTLDLFNPPPPRQRHSETSCEAADALERTAAAGTLRARVLQCLRKCGDHGATDDEIQDTLNMNPSTERPRRIELLRLGVVYDSGLWRYTKAGRRAVVWRAHTEGR